MQSRELDQLDRRILRALQVNARLTNAELAEKVALSNTACWNRVKKLEADGIIQGYVALIDQHKLGVADTVILEITLERHDEDSLMRFGDQLCTLPEVLEVWITSGEYDYVAKIAVDGTAGYERFLREKLYRIGGIRHSRSMFALRCLKRATSVEVV